MKLDYSSNIKNKDNEYKQLLATNLNCYVENLSSIVGPDEFIDILRKYKPENFFTGDFLSDKFEERYKNILNNTFRINLHMHTEESDGIIKVEELLEQAACYAKKVKNNISDDLPPFVISVTDHDNLTATKKALKLISENPGKFEDIKFVTGIEFSVKLDNSQILKKPQETDLMGYCINPFDENLNNFLNNTKNSRIREAKKILSKLNKYGINETWESVKNAHSLINIAGSMAFFYFIKRHLYNKYKKSPQLQKHKEQIEMLFADKQVEFSPSIKEVNDIIKKSFGFIGLAHPARIHLNYVDKNKVVLNKYKDINQEALFEILKDSFSQGAGFSESNYQYTVRHYDSELQKLIDTTNTASNELNFLRTGGTDGHRANIFTHIENLTDEELNLLLGRDS